MATLAKEGNAEMETVYLKVTTSALEQKDRAPNQEQIALRSTSKSVSEKIAQANKTNQLCVRLANAFELILCDNGAIWRAHNKGNEQVFDRLFTFLSEQPDQELEFICAIKN